MYFYCDKAMTKHQEPKQLGSERERSEPQFFLCKISFKFMCDLVRVSIAVKKHHDHGNSYKGRDLIGHGEAHLQVQRFSPLSP